MMGGFGAWSLEDEGNFDPTHTEFCLDISTRLSTLYHHRHATITTLCRGCGSWVVCFVLALFNVVLVFYLASLPSSPPHRMGRGHPFGCSRQ